MAQIFRTDPKRLGEFLISAGVVTKADIQQALAEKGKTGELLGEVLVRKGLASERDVAEVISAQFSIPFIEVDQFDISMDAFAAVDTELMEKYCFVPLDKLGDVLLIAMGGVLGKAVTDEIESKCGCSLQVVVSTATAVRAAIESQKRRRLLETGAAKKQQSEEALRDGIEEDVEIELLVASDSRPKDLAETEDAQIAREIERQLAEMGGDEAANEVERMPTSPQEEGDFQTAAPPEEPASRKTDSNDDDLFDPHVIKPGE